MKFLGQLSSELDKHGIRDLSASTAHSFSSDDEKLHHDRRDFPGIECTKGVRIELACQDAEADFILDAIYAVAHTGLPGNGHVVVLPILDALRLRNGERGADALGLRSVNGNRSALGLSASEPTRSTTP